MLRPLLVMLLVANALLLAAHLGVFDSLVPEQAQGEREPDRLARQIRPDAVRVTPGGRTSAQGTPVGPARAGSAPSAAASVPVPAAAGNTDLAASGASRSPASGGMAGAVAVPSAPLTPEPVAACVQLAPLDAAGLSQVTNELRQAGWAESQWQRLSLPADRDFLLVMGPYRDEQQRVKKQNELRRRQVEWVDLVASPDLPAGVTPGLGLGRFDSEAAARDALKRLGARGVRTARVVALRSSDRSAVRIAAADVSQQARLSRMAWPGGLQWQPCPALGAADQGR